jgi:hypothetical protein
MRTGQSVSAGYARRRARAYIETVLDYARVSGYRSGENPARWRGHLVHRLPPCSKVRRVQHPLALPAHRFRSTFRDWAHIRRRLLFSGTTLVRGEQTLGGYDRDSRFWSNSDSGNGDTVLESIDLIELTAGLHFPVTLPRCLGLPPAKPPSGERRTPPPRMLS